MAKKKPQYDPNQPQRLNPAELIRHMRMIETAAAVQGNANSEVMVRFKDAENSGLHRGALAFWKRLRRMDLPNAAAFYNAVKLYEPHLGAEITGQQDMFTAPEAEDREDEGQDDAGEGTPPQPPGSGEGPLPHPPQPEPAAAETDRPSPVKQALSLADQVRIYYEGVDAYDAGEGITTCPYPGARSKSGKLWQQGWSDRQGGAHLRWQRPAAPASAPADSEEELRRPGQDLAWTKGYIAGKAGHAPTQNPFHANTSPRERRRWEIARQVGADEREDEAARESAPPKPAAAPAGVQSAAVH